MNKRRLNKVFGEIKEKAKLDFAITNADEYGDCQTCTWSEICFEFGDESKGIWLKHWERGMNASRPIKHQDYLYIAHDITEEQANILINTFIQQGYDIEPKQYNESKCFKITENT